ENTANYNWNGIFLEYYSDSNSIIGNIADNNDFSGIYLRDQCDSNDIIANNASENGYGIYLEVDCDANTIWDNLAHDNGFGIYLYHSHNNVIFLNDLSNIFENIHEEGCWNVFQENLIQGAQIGINLDNSTGNEIDSNTFVNNGIGIVIRNSTDNSVLYNIFENNNDYAIIVKEYSNDNEVYYNEFIDNNNGGVQAYDDSGENSWTDDQGIGNYWNDFLQRYPDSERDDTMWTGDYELDGQIGVTDGGSQVFSPSGIDKFLTTINDLIDFIQNLPDDCWENAEIKNAMIDKLLEIKVDVSLGNLEEAYDKLLHDIKPKLTALKTDEIGEVWGNGIFNKPWIVIEEMFEMFRLVCNDLLSQIQTLITDI
ncbi:MAG: right-handed parallel beta-helix repeat-containing protein, partial [Candidatus Lokiarchaeota archaeon]|nr:right-handed parallel beta-helix repeat-containing protein [Candidatus Lokiarchaeota archaeon]